MPNFTQPKSVVALTSFLLGAAILIGGCNGRDTAVNVGGSPPLEYRNAQAGSANVTVYANRRLGPVNRNLTSVHQHPVIPSAQELKRQLAQPKFVRGVQGPSTIKYDCETRRFDAVMMSEFQGWFDRILALGAIPIVSLSYVPTCITHQDSAKAPPQDAAAYERYLDDLFAELIGKRIAQGKRPIEYFEPWNEPDLPTYFYNEADGHGFNGTLDQYISTIFIPLGHAVVRQEALHGIDIRLGTAALWWGKHITIGGSDASLFDLSVPEDPILSQQVLGVALGGGAELSLNTEWLDRMVAEAGAAGIPLDFISWHQYPGYPLYGYTPDAEPQPSNPLYLLSTMRNPNVSPDIFAEDANGFAARYPGLELFMSEWRMSSGPDVRVNTYDEAAFNFASHAVMQATPLKMAGSGSLMGPTLLTSRLLESQADDRIQMVLHDAEPVRHLWADGAATGQADRITVSLAHWHSYEEAAEARDVLVEFNDLSPGDYVVNLYRIDKDHSRDAASISEADALQPKPTERFLLRVEAGKPAYLSVPLSGQAAVFLDMTAAMTRKTQVPKPNFTQLKSAVLLTRF